MAREFMVKRWNRRMKPIALIALLGALASCSAPSSENPEVRDDSKAPGSDSEGTKDASSDPTIDAPDPAAGDDVPSDNVPVSDAGVDSSAGPLPTPPADLVKCLSSKPYVEGTCSPTTVAGWPHEAQACSYSSPIGTLKVTVADASATQVAIWIMDAGDSIPAIAHLKSSDASNYLRALKSVATALMLQSGRIFPIQGDVGEDLGSGYTPFHFDRGVTKTCPAKEPGCYCRINSLSRADYCAYRSSQGVEKESACKTRVNYGQGFTNAWADACLGNHAASWGKAKNENIRAQIWARLKDSGISDDASGAQVVKALDQAYGIGSSMVNSFCK